MARMKGTLKIDTARCKGCEVCVVNCPFQVLALAPGVNAKGYHYCMSAKPDECTGCASCALVCPDGCITVFRQR